MYPLLPRLRSYSHEFAEYMGIRRLKMQRNEVIMMQLARFADKVRRRAACSSTMSTG